MTPEKLYKLVEAARVDKELLQQKIKARVMLAELIGQSIDYKDIDAVG